jgi:aspartate 1-decarboxylase
MLLTMMKGKLHKAVITDANRDYEGSIAIDADLLKQADILPNEQVHVWDITNSVRFVTYAIEAPAGSKTIAIQGAAAPLVKVGDQIIIAAFCQMEAIEAKIHKPKVVLLNEKNEVK